MRLATMRTELQLKADKKATLKNLDVVNSTLSTLSKELLVRAKL